MSATADPQSLPTMLIPRGTEIRTNAQGLLSIRTPGNLIIQNSGSYGEIESTGGSIRIDQNVNVEAVSIRAAQGCFIQGTLTAWRVQAKRIALDERARAYIMLQESDHLELGKQSRLVGNFANEKEVYLMLGKFSSQLKELPGSVDLQTQASFSAPMAAGAIEAFSAVPAPPAPSAPPGDDLSESLQQAASILERESQRADLEPRESRLLRDLLGTLRSRDLNHAASTYRDVFTELRQPSESLRLAFNILDSELRYL